MALWIMACASGGTSTVGIAAVVQELDWRGTTTAVGGQDDGEAGGTELWAFAAIYDRLGASGPGYGEYFYGRVGESGEPVVSGPVSVLVSRQDVCAALWKYRGGPEYDAHAAAGAMSAESGPSPISGPGIRYHDF